MKQNSMCSLRKQKYLHKLKLALNSLPITIEVMTLDIKHSIKHFLIGSTR